MHEYARYPRVFMMARLRADQWRRRGRRCQRRTPTTPTSVSEIPHTLPPDWPDILGRTHALTARAFIYEEIRQFLASFVPTAPVGAD